MNRLKELQEKLGAVRKKLNQFTNERAEKLSKLTALSEKDELTDEEQSTFNTLSEEIDGIDTKMKAQQTVADNLKEQINQERVNGDDPFGGMHFMDSNEETSEEKELSKFSVTKAIRDSLESGRPQGFEREIVDEGIKELKNSGRNPEGNIVLPSKLMQLRSPVNAQTATGGTGGDQGGVTIQTDVLSLIDILRAKLPFVDSTPGAGDGLGATFWNDLQGDITFPKAEEDFDELTSKTENETADEQDPTYDSISMSPTRRAGFAEVSRQLILQSSVSVESWLRNYLMYKLAKSMNIDIITYLLGLTGTNAIENGTDGGALTWAKIVEFETAIAAADAEEEERFAFLTNPKVRGKLKTTTKESGQAIYLWDRDDRVNNYPAFTSTLVPSDLTKGAGTALSAAIFANWASLYIGMWGPVEMLVNPFSKDKEGLIRLNIWNFSDRVARHAASFSVSKDIVTS